MGCKELDTTELLSASSHDELPYVGGQGQQPRVPGCDYAGTAERSHPASEFRGGGRVDQLTSKEQWLCRRRRA